MRFFLRSLLLWVITLPLSYIYGLPYLLKKLDAKAQAQSYDACLQHLKDEHLIGGPGWVIRQKDAEKYCHCVSDSLHLTAADLPELVQHKSPARFTAEMKPVVEACNATLKAGMDATIKDGPGTRIERTADGTEIIHFN